MADKKKMKRKAEKLKAKAELAAGAATESEKIQARGKLDDSDGKVRG